MFCHTCPSSLPTSERENVAMATCCLFTERAIETCVSANIPKGLSNFVIDRTNIDRKNRLANSCGTFLPLLRCLLRPLLLTLLLLLFLAFPVCRPNVIAFGCFSFFLGHLVSCVLLCSRGTFNTSSCLCSLSRCYDVTFSHSSLSFFLCISIICAFFFSFSPFFLVFRHWPFVYLFLQPEASASQPPLLGDTVLLRIIFDNAEQRTGITIRSDRVFY